MPELPDLTVFANNLTKKLKGRKIKSVEFFSTQRLNVTTEEFQKTVCDKAIEEVNRVGKETEFVFSNGTKLHVHLMLTGMFTIGKSAQNVSSKILTLTFFDGDLLVISDPKGLVTLKLNPVPSMVPDALDAAKDYLKERMVKKPKVLVKTFLIDQGVIRGIGNAYADEILWRAKISPKSIVGKLPDAVIDDLVNSIRIVLLDAIEEIKKKKPEIISGEIRDFLIVHNPFRRTSPEGHVIIKEQIASKTTYYTDEQILYI
ncbi:MAG: DNA-formamidopyrimidine glycosylase family protein [Ignavibacteria bacterium]|nr:DNA-formamidopyrimidine glycosylase family protein [Ignavibacteria bacterium]